MIVYCNVCGAENLEGSQFCSACGISIATSEKQQAKPKLEITEEEHYIKSWRNMMAAPITLIVMIIYSASVLLNAVNIRELMGSVSAFLVFLGEESSLRDELLYILMVAPGVATAIGMWMLYAEAFNTPNMPLYGTGFQVIKIINIITFVLYGVGFAVLASELNEFTQEVAQSDILKPILENYAWEFAQIVAIIILAVITKIKLISMLTVMYDCSSYGYASISHIGDVAIFQFILGGWVLYLQAGLGLGVTDSLPALLSAAMPFVWGGMLLRYKSYMNKIEQEYRTLADEDKLGVAVK